MAGEFPEIVAGGERRILNLQRSPTRMMQAVGPMSVGKLPPISQIKTQKRRPAYIKIRNQGSYGACVGHGSARGVELSRALAGMHGAGGENYTPLSPWDVYARLCGGIDRGASIGQALTLLSNEGVTLDSLVPQGTINPNQISQQARAERHRFMVALGGVISSFEQMAWAVADGYAVVYSVFVAPGVWDVDATGRPPARRGTANHCVVTNGDITIGRDGALELGSDNSWTTQWGQQGTFKCTDKLIQCQSYFEGWMLVAPTFDSEADIRPPVSPVV